MTTKQMAHPRLVVRLERTDTKGSQKTDEISTIGPREAFDFRELVQLLLQSIADDGSVRSGGGLRIECHGVFSETEPFLEMPADMVSEITNLGAALRLSLVFEPQGKVEGERVSSEVRVALVLSGTTFDPSEVSQRIGLSPTSTTHIGNLLTPRVRARRDLWSLATPTRRGDDLAIALTSLLNEIDPRNYEIASFVRESGATATIAVDLDYVDWIPTLDITAEQLSRIARSGAGVAVDVVRRESLP